MLNTIKKINSSPTSKYCSQQWSKLRMFLIEFHRACLWEMSWIMNSGLFVIFACVPQICLPDSPF
jgi:hypothetical protein